VEAIIVAVIAAVGTVLAGLVQKSRRENKNDHNTVAEMIIDVKDQIINLHHKIDHVDNQVDKVEVQMQDHMMWHYRKSNQFKKKEEV
jgi:hypothetical protein